MNVKVLMENTALSSEFHSEHGLSLYIETENHKILFDMGKSPLFLENAKTMGVDLAAVDIAVLSHGHYDHGGGLPSFLKINKTAPIYIHEKAGEGHYARRKNDKIEEIGIEPALLKNPRVINTKGDWPIEKECLLFSTVEKQTLRSVSNDVLLEKQGGNFIKDSFGHEQSLLLTENGKTILFAGCAHRGIVNIMDRAMELVGGPPDIVIGGFHLSNPSAGQCEPLETIQGIAQYLNAFPTKYYTCHCTGLEAYEQLKSLMGKKIDYVSAGSQMVI